MSRSVVIGDWLYMRTIHDGYHLFDREMLYNISKDPYERYDVKDKYPEVCAECARLILTWQEDLMLKDPLASDPMWTVMKEGGPQHTKTDLPAYIERLKKYR